MEPAWVKITGVNFNVSEYKDITGKPHNDVLKAIRGMELAWVKVTGGNFSLSGYRDITGRKINGCRFSLVEYSDMQSLSNFG